MAGFLKDGIVPRSYQSAIAQSALSRGNTLVVLPTGMGKTLVAFLVMEKKLSEGGSAVFLAPTKPLVQQHCRAFLQMSIFPEEDCALITGEISPKKRAMLWKRKVCFSTPQSLQNDLKAGRASPAFSVCIIDEAHRSVGNYAYTFVAQKCSEAGSLMLALTASPGGSRQRIEEIVAALSISNIEIRTAHDSDVSPYMQQLDTEFIRVPLGSELSNIRGLLSEMLSDYAERLSLLGYHAPLRSKRGLVELRMKILRSNSPSHYSALSFYSTIFNLVHMLELIETQGLSTFLSYVERMKAREETKARRRIFSDARFQSALELCKSASEHPKLAKLLEILQQRKGEKTLVFAQYRDQVAAIVFALRKAGFSAERFVGKKEGVTSEEQKGTLSRFSRGEFGVLAATSIGEEGLDIPAVDNVVFFEPIPSEIRTIQRRGRAGRLQAGKVFVLIASGTRDEAYLHSSRKKEEAMKRIVLRMQAGFSSGEKQRKMAGAPQRGRKKNEGVRPSRKERKKMAVPMQLPAPKGSRGATQCKITDFWPNNKESNK